MQALMMWVLGIRLLALLIFASPKKHSGGAIMCWLEPSGKCSRKISNIMFERLEPKGFKWKEVSKDTKLFYFEEFKKWVAWRQPDNVIYEGWYKSAGIRYKDLRCRAHEQWESKSELNNRIGRDVWLSWIEDWKTSAFKSKSKTKRKNRRGGVDVNGPYPATHMGGSASHRTHAAVWQ